MKILSIGNSFSEDATAYLHKISEAGNSPIDVYNLYIGGCSLHMHACNIKSGEKKYRLEYNGIYTDRTVSVNESLRRTAGISLQFSRQAMIQVFPHHTARTENMLSII